MNNLTVCPKCIGEGEYYSFLEDNVIICKLCKGNKKVNNKIADCYDPVADELTDLIFDDEEK
jgi:hypothetical protein